ncbi:hypothetical protein [Streptomyces sp. NPDC126499]|uniref:hypothetical protein n=1 Tax=Streptomyces sp. NPDC126499 TaxID=3155314 RepID=UPI00331A693D
MYGQGHGYPQPAPPQRGVPASVIVLRVLFAVLPLLSLGMLTWVTALRIGLLTRRVVDWVLLAVSVAVVIAAFVLIPEDENDTSLQGDLVVGMVLLNAVAFTAYFLVADIRHARVRAAGAPVPGEVPPPYNPYAATVPQRHQGYGYPPVAPAAPVTPVPAQPVAPAQPLASPPPHAVAPPTTPPQFHTPPSPPVAGGAGPGTGPRIDEVRAELDELSRLLRKDEGK